MYQVAQLYKGINLLCSRKLREGFCSNANFNYFANKQKHGKIREFNRTPPLEMNFWIDDLEYRSAIEVCERDNTTILTVRDFSKKFTDIVIGYLLWSQRERFINPIIIFLVGEDKPFASNVRDVILDKLQQGF